MSDTNRVEWGKVIVGGSAATMLVAALLFAFIAGRGAAPPVRPTVAPVAPVAPVAAAALRPIAAPAPTVPTAPAPHVPTDADIALRISTLSGEELIGDLWSIDRVSENVPYDLLARNAARQAGKVVVFTGRVLEIQDLPQGGSFIRLSLDSYGARVVAVFTYVEPPDDVLQNRRVRAYGTTAGAFEYTSQAGWNISIPRINAVAVVNNNVPRRAPRDAASASAPRRR